MDQAPQTRLALGPLEISLRRRGPDEVRRIGVPGSLVVHVAVLLLWILLAPYSNVEREKDIVLAAEPQVPVTFVNPFPPQPPPQPLKPQPRQEIRKTPPPAAAAPLRMQEPPKETITAQNAPKRESVREIGAQDTKPAGGQSGGPLPDNTPGFPDPGQVAPTAPEPPKDLQGRLRDFRRALETPQTGTKKGGGSGTGGLTMPDVPAIGMGIGNLEFESRDYDWSSYARSIYWAIWRKWHMKMLASVGVFERWGVERQRRIIDARSRIVFTIERSGRVSGVAVETPSGIYPFDDSATDALNEVLLPPLPADFARDRETVHATFVGEDVDIQAMRGSLEYLRGHGIIY
ncbi:MAG TPA: energy transducer TonB [Candidatus Polarisedimenticolaceae bacterium]|nr:energy transducer TonB [Candidatus Polarisedimenticolaceae bacterium]